MRLTTPRLSHQLQLGAFPRRRRRALRLRSVAAESLQPRDASLAKLERPESLEERHEARVLDVAGAPVAVDGEVGEAGGGHVSRAGLVVREAVLVDVTTAVDLQGLRVGLGLVNPNPDPNPDP